MCELGSQHLSVTALEGGVGLLWEGLQVMWSSNTFFRYFKVSIGCGGGEVCTNGNGGGRGDATVALGLFEILVSVSCVTLY
jgi:hypothetical protein